MANEEKKNVNTEETKANVNELPKEVKDAIEADKKKWYQKLGLGVKIAAGVVATVVVGGVVYVITRLVGKDDEDESEAASEEAPTEE